MCLAIHVAAAFLAVDAGTPPSAAAEPAPSPAAVEPDAGVVRNEAHEAAQAALSAGNRRFKAGDYAGALADYQRAKSLYPDGAAKVEFNIAKTEAALGHDDAAAEAFERFLDLPPTNLVTALADYRQEASAALQRLSAGLGRVRLISRRDDLGVLIDGQPRGATPLPGMVRVRPGHHLVTLRDRDGLEVFKEEIDVRAGDTVQVIVEWEPKARESEPEPEIARGSLSPALSPVAAPASGANLAAGPTPESGSDNAPVWKKWWFWVAGGTVVAAAVMTLVLTLGSSSEAPCPNGWVCAHTPVPKQ